MSNGNATRRSHIHRVYQDNDPTSDSWIDVERLDELQYEEKRTFPYQLKVWDFDWSNFDPDATDGSVTKKKVFSPDDKTSYVEVPTRNGIEVVTGKGFHWRNIWHYFVNTADNNTRGGHIRRVVHYDIDANQLDGSGQPPSDPDQYMSVLGDRDDEQYVRVEVIEGYQTAEGRAHLWQDKRWLVDAQDDPLLADPIVGDPIDASYVGGDDVDGDGGIDPPWRLDPLQNIVNVSWLSGLAVIFGPQASDAPKQGG